MDQRHNFQVGIENIREYRLPVYKSPMHFEAPKLRLSVINFSLFVSSIIASRRRNTLTFDSPSVSLVCSVFATFRGGQLGCESPSSTCRFFVEKNLSKGPFVLAASGSYGVHITKNICRPRMKCRLQFQDVSRRLGRYLLCQYA